MVWPVAAIYALSFWPATAYNLGAGAFLVALYTAWSGGLPWDHTFTVDLTNAQQWQAAAVWVALAWVVVAGGRRLLRETGVPRSPDPLAVAAAVGRSPVLSHPGRPGSRRPRTPDPAERNPALRG